MCNAYAPELDESAVTTSNIATRQRQCMRAFQTDCSWYQAYWYPTPQQRRPRAVGRTFPALIAFWSVTVACLHAMTARL
jgi:hypothetical protein